MSRGSDLGSVSTRLHRIAELARQAPEMVIVTLAHHIDLAWMYEAYRQTRKNGAVGIDEVTAAEYAADLRPAGLHPLLGAVALGGLGRQRKTARTRLSRGIKRVSEWWETEGLGTVRAARGRFAQSQAIYQLQVEDGIDTFFPAEWADHSVLSWERTLPSGVMVRVEGYRKTMTRPRPHFENLFDDVALFPEGELDRVEVAPDRAEARGLEVLVKPPGERRFAWWIGCAVSKAEDLIDDEWVPRSWEQRRVVSFSLSWALRSSWSLNLAGLYHSGWPATYGSADRVQQPDGSWTILSTVGVRNADRLPSYQRIDLRVGRSFEWGKGRARAFLEIMNLFNHRNVRSQFVSSFGRTPDGSLTLRTDDETWFPAFASLGFDIEF